MSERSAEEFSNRLRKNARHRRRWAKREGLTAYRVYDRDLPGYPFVIEWYDGRAHVVEYPRHGREDLAARGEVLAAVGAVLEVPPERIFTKTHLPKPWGREQYGKAGEHGERFTVKEGGLSFWVNLGEFLDTGLFLDHRLTRERVREESLGKRFLNLFGYTGSFSVYAAAGGAASTTTVDLSNTYCDWAKANLELNGFSPPRHEVVRSDVLRWVRQAAEQGARFDLVVLDPPSFSSSKKMAGSFNVQKDHPRLLDDVGALLSPGGVLYFSTNYQGFELDEEALGGWQGEELTPATIPEDFHHRGVHRCWRLTRA
ncbi:MAG: class I SAM-dependent methyltransferase [Myxococcaceae bacterium]